MVAVRGSQRARSAAGAVEVPVDGKAGKARRPRPGESWTRLLPSWRLLLPSWTVLEASWTLPPASWTQQLPSWTLLRVNRAIPLGGASPAVSPRAAATAVAAAASATSWPRTAPEIASARRAAAVPGVPLSTAAAAPLEAAAAAVCGRCSG
eukprot:scaffold23080_cov73-Isochrysis_galbana.AAC.1